MKHRANLLRTATAAGLAIVVSLAAGQASAQKTIRFSYVLAPVFLAPLIFELDNSVLRHKGKSYNIELFRFRGTPQSLTAMAAGEIDIASLSFSSFAGGVVNARQDLRAIVDVAQDGPNFSTPFVVLDNSGIKTVADLKGKVLAINARGSGVDMGARSVLIKNGLKPGADVSIVEARFPAMEAMLRQGKTHVVVMPAPFLARATAKGGIRILFRQRDGIGNAQFLFHAAKTDFIRKNRAVMVDLMEDYVRGTHWFLDPANREAALDIVARIAKRPKKAFTSWVFRKGKDLDHSPNGYLDTKALQRNVDVLHEFGILKKSFDVTKFVDHTLLDDANARIK